MSGEEGRRGRPVIFSQEEQVVFSGEWRWLSDVRRATLSKLLFSTHAWLTPHEGKGWIDFPVAAGTSAPGAPPLQPSQTDISAAHSSSSISVYSLNMQTPLTVRWYAFYSCAAAEQGLNVKSSFWLWRVKTWRVYTHSRTSCPGGWGRTAESHSGHRRWGCHRCGS